MQIITIEARIRGKNATKQNNNDKKKNAEGAEKWRDEKKKKCRLQSDDHDDDNSTHQQRRRRQKRDQKVAQYPGTKQHKGREKKTRNSREQTQKAAKQNGKAPTLLSALSTSLLIVLIDS